MLTLLFALACSSTAPAILQQDPAPAPIATPAVDPDTDRYLAFVHEVEATIAEGDAGFLSSSFDFVAMIAAMDAGLDAPDAYREPFTEGLASNFNLVSQIVELNAIYNGSYRFLHLMPGVPTRALFRLAGDNGINYHELHLVASKDSVRVVDAFVYASGEALTTTFKRGYASGLLEFDPTYAERVPEAQAIYFAALGTLQRMQQATALDPAAALEIWAGLNASVKYLPEILTARITAASNVGDAEYLAALGELRTHYPDSRALNLMMIDAHLLRGEFNKSLKRVDALDEQLGGDPYLDLLRGGILRGNGAFERALGCVRRAVEADPRLDYDAQWQFVEIGLASDRHVLTFAALVALETDYGMEWVDLRTAAGYESFVVSEVGQHWMERWIAANGDGR